MIQLWSTWWLRTASYIWIGEDGLAGVPGATAGVEEGSRCEVVARNVIAEWDRVLAEAEWGRIKGSWETITRYRKIQTKLSQAAKRKCHTSKWLPEFAKAGQAEPNESCKWHTRCQRQKCPCQLESRWFQAQLQKIIQHEQPASNRSYRVGHRRKKCWFDVKRAWAEPQKIQW